MSTFNSVKKDRYNRIFIIYNQNQKTVEKLQEKMKKYKIDRLIYEKGINIVENRLENEEILKFFIPDIYLYIRRLIFTKMDEIFVIVNNFNDENLKIIKELALHTKVVNIVSSNKKYCELEESDKENGCYFSVTNNKRKSLKKAEIIVDLDERELTRYKINRDAIIISNVKNLNISEYFNGIIVRGCEAFSKKVLRIFYNLDNFRREDLIAGELLKINNYDDARFYIKNHKIYLNKLFGKKELKQEDFRKYNIKSCQNIDKTSDMV